MNGTIIFGDNIDSFINDAQEIVKELDNAVEDIGLIVNQCQSNEMYIGTATDQLVQFANSLSMQIDKMKSFYELGVKYMENSREQMQNLDQKVAQGLETSLNTVITSKR